MKRTWFDIRTRIGFAFVIIALVFGAAAFAAYRTSVVSQRVFGTYVDQAAPRTVVLTEMRERASELNTLASLLAHDTNLSSETSSQIILRILALSGQLEQLYADYRALGADVRSFTRVLEAKERVVRATIAYGRIHIVSYEATVQQSTSTQATTAGLAVAPASSSTNDLAPALAALNDALRSVADEERTYQYSAEDMVTHEVLSSTRLMLGLGIATLAGLSVLAMFIERSIFRPLGELRAASLDVARGKQDREAVVHGRNELADVARAFNLMLRRVRHAQAETDEKAKKLSDTLFELGMLERSTNEERELYKLLLTSIGDGVLVIDEDLRVSLANAAASEILRRPIETLYSGHVDAVFDIEYRITAEPLKDLDFWRQVFKLSSPGIYEDVFTVRDSRGIALPIALVVAPVRDEDGRVRRVIATFRDITELVRIEEARISFVSAASHQLRTPLSSMRWFTEMLLDGDLGALSEKQREALTTFSQSTLHMIGLVNALLQLSRVEAKRVAVHPEPIVLTELVEEVIAELTQEAKANGNTISLEDRAELPPIPLDHELVRQVIMNYLTNAIRYSTKGSPITVTLTTEYGMVRFAVRNEGIGVPDKAATHMFQKFYRADNARTLVPNGNGIGLALVKLLVEDWGGTVGFSSENGTTEFYGTIPMGGMRSRAGEVTLKV